MLSKMIGKRTYKATAGGSNNTLGSPCIRIKMINGWIAEMIDETIDEKSDVHETVCGHDLPSKQK